MVPISSLPRQLHTARPPPSIRHECVKASFDETCPRLRAHEAKPHLRQDFRRWSDRRICARLQRNNVWRGRVCGRRQRSNVRRGAMGCARRGRGSAGRGSGRRRHPTHAPARCIRHVEATLHEARLLHRFRRYQHLHPLFQDASATGSSLNLQIAKKAGTQPKD